MRWSAPRVVSFEDQDFCDWCYGRVTKRDRDESTRLGLAAQQALACSRCRAQHRYVEPPGGWAEGEPWPFAT